MQTFRDLRAKVSTPKLNVSPNLKEDLNHKNNKENANGSAWDSFSQPLTNFNKSHSTQQTKTLNNLLSLPSNQSNFKSKPSRIRRLSSTQLANAVSPFELDAMGDESLASITSEEGSVGFNGNNMNNYHNSTPGRTPELTPDSSPLPKSFKLFSINANNHEAYPDSPLTVTSFKSTMTSASSSSETSSTAKYSNDVKTTWTSITKTKASPFLPTSDSDSLEYMKESIDSVQSIGVQNISQDEMERSFEMEQQEEESGDLDGIEMRLKESVDSQKVGSESDSSSSKGSSITSQLNSSTELPPQLQALERKSSLNLGLYLLPNDAYDGILESKKNPEEEMQSLISPTSQSFRSFSDSETGTKDSAWSAINSRTDALSKTQSSLQTTGGALPTKEDERKDCTPSSSLGSLEIISEFQEKFPSPPLRTPASIKDLMVESPFFRSTSSSSSPMRICGGKTNRGSFNTIASSRRDSATPRSTLSQLQGQDELSASSSSSKSQLLPAVTLSCQSKDSRNPTLSNGALQLGNIVASPLAKRRLEKNQSSDLETVLHRHPYASPLSHGQRISSSPNTSMGKVDSPRVTFSPAPPSQRGSPQTGSGFNVRRTSRFFYVKDGEPLAPPSRPLPATPDGQDRSRLSGFPIREPPMSAPLTHQPFFPRSPNAHNEAGRSPNGTNGRSEGHLKKGSVQGGVEYDDWLWTKGSSGRRSANQVAGMGGVLGYTGRRPLHGGHLHTLKLPSRYSSLSPSSSKPKTNSNGGRANLGERFTLSQRALLSPTTIDSHLEPEHWEDSNRNSDKLPSSNALGLLFESEHQGSTMAEAYRASIDPVPPLAQVVSRAQTEGSLKNAGLKALNLPSIVTRPRSNSRSAPSSPSATQDDYFTSSPVTMETEEDLLPPPSLSALLGQVPSSPSSSSDRCVHPPEMVCLAGCCSHSSPSLNSTSSFRRIVSDSHGSADPTDIQASSDALVHATEAGANLATAPSLKKKLSKPSLRRLTISMKKSKSNPALRKAANAAGGLNVPNTIESCDESFHCLEAGIGDLEQKEKEIERIQQSEFECESPQGAKVVEVDAVSTKSKGGATALIKSLARVAGFRRSFKGGFGKENVGEEKPIPALTESMKIVAAEKERELHVQAHSQAQAQAQASSYEDAQNDASSASSSSRAPVLSMSFLGRSLPLTVSGSSLELETKDSSSIAEGSAHFDGEDQQSIPLTSTLPSTKEGQTGTNIPASTSQFLSPTLIVSDSNSQMEIRSITTNRSSTGSDPFHFTQFETQPSQDQTSELRQSSESVAAVIKFGSDSGGSRDYSSSSSACYAKDSVDSDYSAASLSSNMDNLNGSIEDDSQRTRFDPEYASPAKGEEGTDYVDPKITP